MRLCLGLSVAQNRAARVSARALFRESPKNRRQLLKHRGRAKRLRGRDRLPVLAGVGAGVSGVCAGCLLLMSF